MTRFTVSPDGWEEDTLWAMEPAGPIAVLQARDLGHSHQYWPELVALIMGPDLIDQAITTEQHDRDRYHRQQSGVRG